MKKELLVLLCAGLLTCICSCKRNDVFGGIEPNTNRIIAEFTDAKQGTYVSSDFSAEPIELDLTELRLNPRSVTNGTTTIKVVVNAALVADYNAANGTNYTPAPAAAFSLSPSTYVVTPDSRKVAVRAALRPSAFLDKQYAVGLAIGEVSGGEISSIAHNVIVFISIKNNYDGVYSLKGYSNIPGTPYSGAFALTCAEELELATSSATGVYLSPSQPVFNAGAFTYITNLLPGFEFDKVTGKITSVFARSGSLGLLFPYDASYDSRYDAATKSIFVKYGIEPAGSGRYIIDTLTFCKPR
ncbi:MAG TPA: DUF1735 domain-containing protein [Flavisolibacter sp.]|jgi:hypothetical protein|nr:DUF1735 domain-containing protein [Flavisolibacter sp.]